MHRAAAAQYTVQAEQNDIDTGSKRYQKQSALGLGYNRAKTEKKRTIGAAIAMADVVAVE